MRDLTRFPRDFLCLNCVPSNLFFYFAPKAYPKEAKLADRSRQECFTNAQSDQFHVITYFHQRLTFSGSFSGRTAAFEYGSFRVELVDEFGFPPGAPLRRVVILLDVGVALTQRHVQRRLVWGPNVKSWVELWRVQSQINMNFFFGVEVVAIRGQAHINR